MGIRIIGGLLRGKKLKSVPGLTTRPSADYLKESLFNILSFQLEGAVVLDLFAGTGALGIEALSRGAASALFVDKYRAALSVIEKNIKLCAMENRSKIVKWDILKNLNCIKSATPAFDIVFMDPPYNRSSVKQTLGNLQASCSLANKAMVIVEHTPKEPIPSSCFGFKIVDQRRYGKKSVSFLNHVKQTQQKRTD